MFPQASFPFVFSLKKALVSTLAASTLAGLLIGFLDVKCTAYVPCFLAPFMSNDKVIQAIICMVFAAAAAFVFTAICNTVDKNKAIEE